MIKYYYGMWQNFYKLNWPVRFLIELTVIFFVILFLIKIMKSIGRKFHIGIRLSKMWVWLVTEIVYLIGRNRKWAIEIDDRMITWGYNVANGTGRKKHFGLKWFFFGVLFLLYVMAVFVDLPVSKYFGEYYLLEMAKVKTFFQRYEAAMSNGYEGYPPLFIAKEKDETEEEEADETEEEEADETVWINLSEKVKSSANIRQEPSLNGKVLCGATQETELIYNGQWESDGQRYWIRVFLPDSGTDGWLSGGLIDENQLEMIITGMND